MLKQMILIIIVILFMISFFLYGAETQLKQNIDIYKDSELTAVELSRLLGIKIWKLNISLPNDAEKVKLSLAIQEKGQEKRDFGAKIEAIISPETKRQILIAILPINGSIGNAEKLRVVIDGFGTTAYGIEGNPFINLRIGSQEFPEKNNDDTFSLIGGYKGDTVASPMSKLADVFLSLNIEAE